MVSRSNWECSRSLPRSAFLGTNIPGIVRRVGATTWKSYSVHIDIQISKQEHQHYHRQDHHDDSQHPKALAKRKFFYRLFSAPRWPMVVHEDGGPKVRDVKTESSRAIPADCSRSFMGMPSPAGL